MGFLGIGEKDRHGRQNELAMQAILLAINGVIALAGLALRLGILLINVVFGLVTISWKLIAQVPQYLEVPGRLLRNNRVARAERRIAPSVRNTIFSWSSEQIVWASILMFCPQGATKLLKTFYQNCIKNRKYSKHLKYRKDPDSATKSKACGGTTTSRAWDGSLPLLIRHCLTQVRANQRLRPLP